MISLLTAPSNTVVGFSIDCNEDPVLENISFSLWEAIQKQDSRNFAMEVNGTTGEFTVLESVDSEVRGFTSTVAPKEAQELRDSLLKESGLIRHGIQDKTYSVWDDNCPYPYEELRIVPISVAITI